MLKDNKQFVFIIGAPRSGSTWLHNTLASHLEIASTNAELTVFNRYIHPLVRSFEAEQKPIKQGKWTQGLPHIWSREKFDKKIQLFIDDIYSSLPILPGHKIILDKHPDYSFHIDLINYYLSNAKFIHIIRDGREVALSWNRTWHEVGFGNSTFEGACQDWIKYTNAARNAEKYGTTRYIEVRYEDLILNLDYEIERLFNFCNVSFSKDVLIKSMSIESLVSFPDNQISHQERIKGSTWQMSLSKKQKYYAKKNLSQELIFQQYEKNNDWGNAKFIDLKYKIIEKCKWYFNRLKH